ncbi:MAG: hypothetical protein U9R15_13080, partial [Chloroflexota bacterium]|nr:hypothetical protein [Chloroflexota bacterium]
TTVVEFIERLDKQRLTECPPFSPGLFCLDLDENAPIVVVKEVDVFQVNTVLPIRPFKVDPGYLAQKTLDQF